MRTPRAVNSLTDDLFERKYRKVGQEKKRIRIFSRRVFWFNIVTPGKGSKYREFYDLSGRITCMGNMDEQEACKFQAPTFQPFSCSEIYPAHIKMPTIIMLKCHQTQ